MNKSKEFFDAVEAVWNTPVPDTVMARARRSLLDYIAVTWRKFLVQKDFYLI